MADDILPTQPIHPLPGVTTPPDERRRNKQKAPKENEEKNADDDHPKPKEDHRGDWVDEYV